MIELWAAALLFVGALILIDWVLDVLGWRP